MPNLFAIDPTRDGVTHLNVYSRGATELGRWMSNFTRQPMEVGKHGHFESVEGYWYWLGCRDDRLRDLYGFLAKKVGRECERTRTMSEIDFRASIEFAIRVKAAGDPEMVERLRSTNLPLKHYYVYGTPPKTKDAGYRWILDIWDRIRVAGVDGESLFRS